MNRAHIPPAWRHLLVLALLLGAAGARTEPTAEADPYAPARERMVREIAATQRWVADETGLRRLSERTMAVMPSPSETSESVSV